VSWAALEAGAPELAREGWIRFDRTHVAMLGTLRSDGSPRISPIEPFLIGGELVFGVMRSPKWDDLERDPRVVLHSSVSDINGTEGEFKVYGRAIPTTSAGVRNHPGAWWSTRPGDAAGLFAVEIAEAVLVAWTPDQQRMRVLRWSADGGLREDVRDYP